VNLSPAEVEAFHRVIETARSLVRCADEFFPESPGACQEYLDAHENALETFGKVCEEQDETKRLAILKKASDFVERQRSQEAWTHNS